MRLRRMQAAGLSGIFLFLPAVLFRTRPVSGQSAAATGEALFMKRCSGCHARDTDKEGPRLRGVIGRKAGTVPGFGYSEALRNSGFVWNEDVLGKWLENPDSVVKYNDMEFRVSNAAERAALVAYLKSLKN